MCSFSRGDVDTVQLDVSTRNRVTAQELTRLTTGLSTRYLVEGHVFDCNSCWVCMWCACGVCVCVCVCRGGGIYVCTKNRFIYLFMHLFICLFVCLLINRLINFYAGLKACMVQRTCHLWCCSCSVNGGSSTW